ncbi:hypothetical protein [Ktedonobacter racemifer]|uniref:Uncharacterized protein n=1 Tax=Ktedonobacter racemifer DSM 44963 TaxID=485913 RepID=D6TPV8_KTERA|nr:hypothetical protein [Ktedonobacter racemifer]EFH87543.1 hypothetical protein Krac_8877 [Ktedonobacter racemifer DSM 44963]
MHQLPEHEFDDKTIEVSDLPGMKKQGGVRRLWLGSRLTRKQKRRRLFWTSALIVLALLGLLASLAPVRVLIGESFSGNNTPGPNARNLYFVQLLPGWGRLSVDGKPYNNSNSPLPTVLNEQPIHLAGGVHTLTWEGEPFAPLTCQLIVPGAGSVPPARGQACLTTSANTAQYKASVISFPRAVNLTSLPGDEQTKLKQAVQNFLDKQGSSDYVQPGEQYKLDYGAQETFTARQRLQATQSFLLDTDTQRLGACDGPTVGPGCTLQQQDCRLFCTVPVGNNHQANSQHYWDTFVVVREHWNFQGDNTGQQSRANHRTLVLLRISRVKDSWQIAFLPQGYSGFNNPACTLTMGTIFGDTRYRQITQKQQDADWQFATGDRGARGCLAAAQFYINYSRTSTQGELRNADAYLLTRFNVLLAGNAKAHEIWPDLPLTSPQASQAIDEIVSHPNITS